MAATEIQRMIRGRLQRQSYHKFYGRLSRRLAQEKERSSRLRRIRAQEKELAILRHLPIQDFLNFDKLRKGGSAKIIQRCWRKNRLTALRSSRRAALGMKHTGGDLGVKEKAALRQREDCAAEERAILRLQNILAKGQQEQAATPVAGRVDDLMLDYSHGGRGGPDAMRLLELLDRVKESARLKQADRESYSSVAAARTTSTSMTPSPSPATESKSNPRKKYSDYFQSRQQVAVIVEDYRIDKENWQSNQQSRVSAMNRCRRLLQDCSHPWTLEEARKEIAASTLLHEARSEKETETASECKQGRREGGKWEISPFVSAMFRDLPPVTSAGYAQSVRRYRKTMQAHRQDSKWGLVNAAHIGLLNPGQNGPIDLRDLDYTLSDVDYVNQQSHINDKKRKKKKKKFLNDEEESIAWITYASQETPLFNARSKQQHPSEDVQEIPKESNLVNKIDYNEMLLSATERKANALLGDVNGGDLLKKCSQASLLPREKRRASLQHETERVVEKRNRLAEIFCMQSLAFQRKVMYDGTQAGSSKFLSYEEMRNDKATKIQALFRGQKGREYSRHLHAEGRVSDNTFIHVHT